MRIAIVVSFVAKAHERTTDLLLARAAALRGHDVFLLDVGELSCFTDGDIGGTARVVPRDACGTPAELVAALRAEDARRERVSTASLDVLWLRHNPSEFRVDERWMGPTGILFGELALSRGVLVLDHPEALHYAEGKIYLQQFPETVRPRTLVTRSMSEIRSFYEEVRRRMVLKPLDGYGGADVFLIREDATNLGTVVESLGRRGFVVAQEYLPAASEGDVRLFMMNGAPLEVGGRYAAIRRISRTGDFRSNMTAGGVAEPVQPGETGLALAAAVGPALRRDGIFLAGLDLVGDRIVEINTLSPGGLWSAGEFERVDFADAVIQAVERKLVRKAARPETPNRVLAGTD